jgi:hypothetical protein
MRYLADECELHPYESTVAFPNLVQHGRYMESRGFLSFTSYILLFCRGAPLDEYDVKLQYSSKVLN